MHDKQASSESIPNRGPLIVLDTGVLRRENLLHRFEEDRDRLGLNDSQIHLSYLATLEWTGFDWIDFLKAHNAEVRIQTLWDSLPELLKNKETMDANFEIGIENLNKYFRSSVDEAIREDFALRLRARFEEQARRSTGAVLQLLELFEADLFENGRLKKEHQTRFLGLLAAQSAFAPDTFKLQPPKVESWKQWCAMFATRNISFRLDREKNMLAQLWPVFLSSRAFGFGKGQAADIEHYDNLYFGIESAEGILPARIYTHESITRLRPRLEKLSWMLLGIVGQILRRKPPEERNVSAIFGEIVCLSDDSKEPEVISAWTVFKETNEKLKRKDGKSIDITIAQSPST